MSCIGGRKQDLSTAERVELAKKRGSESRQGAKRSPSTASRKVQERKKHNSAMTDRYLSGFDGQEKLPIYESGSGHGRTNSMASTTSTVKEEAAEGMKDAVERDPHALTAPGQEAISHRNLADYERDDSAAPQTVREIV